MSNLVKRTIIKIDSKKCTGCGICANTCYESAIGLRDGKAVLLREDYCDGVGVCLSACPAGAITFEEREAMPFNEAEAPQPLASRNNVSCGCPGALSRRLTDVPASSETEPAVVESQLRQWPIQIKLVPVNVPYLNNADLLVAADCTAYAYGNFHTEFMKNKITVIGCPKLDGADYSEKLTQILLANKIKSVTVVRMEVPCCGGIEHAVKIAVKNCGRMIPWSVVTISSDGRILED